MFILAQLSIRIFHALPTLLVFFGAAVLLGISARKKKDFALLILAIGLSLLFLGIVALQALYYNLEHHWFSSEMLMSLLDHASIWLPTCSGIFLLIGAICIYRKTEKA